MTYTLAIKATAQTEAAGAFVWYESHEKGLGVRFANALQKCLDHITKNPKGTQIRKGKFRHRMVAKFPYRVVFTVDGTTVYVYQIIHTSRKPSKRFGP